MKVRFISSSKSNFGVNPIIKNQFNSLKEFLSVSDLYLIKGNGLNGYINSIFDLRKSDKDYEILHAHYGLCGIVALFSKRNKKIVVSFMGDDLVGTNKVDGSVTFISKVFVKLNKFLAKNFFDHSIVKSDEMLKVLNGYENVSLIPNGVDVNKFYEIEKKNALEKLGWDSKKLHLIFVSNPDRAEKNFKLANDSVNILNNSKIELHTISGMKNPELVYCYNAADALILTSFHEGSPNVIKEAMACNCPIVSTDVGDVSWVMEDIEGCYLTSFEPEDVANNIKSALEFSETKSRTNGRERIMKLGLDSESIANKIIEVYKKVLN